MLGSSVSAREASTTSNDQTEFLGGITNAEDGSALKVGPVVGVWNGLSNDAMNVLADSSASGHYLGNAIFPGLRDNLDSYQVLDVPRKITTAGKGHLYSFDRSFEERKMNNHSNSSHLATIVTRSALSDLWGLGLYTKKNFPDVAHVMYRAESVVEYAYAVTNIQIRSERGKSEIFPNTFKEATTLPAKAQWKAAPDKEVASLKRNNVYILLPATSVLTGHKGIGSRWVYKINVDNTYKGRLVVLGWGQLPGMDCGSTFAPVCRLQSIRMVLVLATEYNLQCWQLDYNTAFLNAEVVEEVYVKMTPGYEEFDENGVLLVMSLLKSLYGHHQSPTNWWSTIDKTFMESASKASNRTRASTPIRRAGTSSF